MSAAEPTRAELREQLNEARCAIDLMRDARDAERARLDSLDPEARALAGCLAALKPYDAKRAGVGGPGMPPAAGPVVRILRHLAARFDVEELLSAESCDRQHVDDADTATLVAALRGNYADGPRW